MYCSRNAIYWQDEDDAALIAVMARKKANKMTFPDVVKYLNEYANCSILLIAVLNHCLLFWYFIGRQDSDGKYIRMSKKQTEASVKSHWRLLKNKMKESAAVGDSPAIALPGVADMSSDIKLLIRGGEVAVERLSSEIRELKSTRDEQREARDEQREGMLLVEDLGRYDREVMTEVMCFQAAVADAATDSRSTSLEVGSTVGIYALLLYFYET